MFKVVCCRMDVWGKGLKHYAFIHRYYFNMLTRCFKTRLWLFVRLLKAFQLYNDDSSITSTSGKLILTQPHQYNAILVFNKQKRNYTIFYNKSRKLCQLKTIHLMIILLFHKCIFIVELFVFVCIFMYSCLTSSRKIVLPLFKYLVWPNRRLNPGLPLTRGTP